MSTPVFHRTAHSVISEQPDSGKSTALEIARHLVFRPNEETAGTGAAIADFLDQGPGTVLYDELDHVDKEAQRRLQQIGTLDTGAERKLRKWRTGGGS